MFELPPGQVPQRWLCRCPSCIGQWRFLTRGLSLSSRPPAACSTQPFTSAFSFRRPSRCCLFQRRPCSSPGPSSIDALPDLDSVLSLRVPTLQHVLKAVRDSFLSEVLSAIVSSPSEVGPWCKLFMLSKCLLANPPRGTGVIRSNWFGLEFRSGEMANSWACGPRCLPTLEGSGHAQSGPSRKPPQLSPFAAATLLVPVEQWKMANTRRPYSPSHLWASPCPRLRFSMRCGQSTPSLILL